MKIDRKVLDIALGESGISSYAQLAREMGCSPQNLYIVLRRGSCRPATAGKIAKALHIPVENLMEAVNE